MKPSFDPMLYLILDLALIGPQPPHRLVASAIAGGATLVQLRGKGVSARELCIVGAELKAQLAPNGIPLIVNDDVAVAAAIGADGVHLGQGDLPPAAARQILGCDALIGLSVGTPEEADGVDATLLDYVSIGPIASTWTKGDAGPAIGIAGFQAVRRLFPTLPAVAIGGISEANAAEIMRAGAAGLAVASALCCAVEPASAARRLRDLIATRRGRGGIMIHNILSIAGSDPSGGAGIQADLKTFAALGCYGMAAVTALTAQNTRGVQGVHVPPADFVAKQIEAIFDDIRVDAVKVGMLANTDIANVVADALQRYRPRYVVLDPVMVATSGDPLLAPEAIVTIRNRLLPMATIVTPNLPEAALLLGAAEPSDLGAMRDAARTLHRLGALAVLVKGGHLSSEGSDDLLWDGVREHVVAAPRVSTRNTHGTGCTLSSAIAALLPREWDLAATAASAKAYVTNALRAADQLAVGQGHGPVHHFHELWQYHSGLANSFLCLSSPLASVFK